MNQIPPTRAKGTDSMTINASPTLLKLKYRSRKTMARVAGMTSFIRSLARTMYSYCPLQPIVYPGGKVTMPLTARCASATYPPMSRPTTST